MDILGYFNPVDFHFQAENGNVSKYSLGAQIAKSTGKLSLSNASKFNIALVGLPVENGKFTSDAIQSTDNIRKELYRLASLDRNLEIVDLGNLKPARSPKATHLALRDITEYLDELGIVTVFFGGSQDLTMGICEAFRNEKFFTLSVIDAVLDIKKGVETFHSSNYLTRVFYRLPQLFQFSLIGYQKHLVAKELMEKISGHDDHLRLGQLRDDISRVEPLLRNTDVASFDMGVLKYTDAPATRQKNPNGLRGEEACQLARYAGLSNRLKVFGLFGLDAGEEKNCMTVKLAAEIIWYFLDGVANRPESGEMVVYQVEVDGLEKPVVFYREPGTNRWWFEVQSIHGEKALGACSEEEYRKASENEIPGRWLKYLQKMDGLSK